MSQFQPDTDRILDAVLSVEAAPALEREQGANLVDAWMDKFGPTDVQTKVQAVELGFIVYVDSLTAVIGVQDCIMEDEQGVFGNEWKTAKEPKKGYNGRDSWWWNEDVWLTDISNGAQVQIYALALNRGVFYEHDSTTGVPLQFNVAEPRIRVRAAVKSEPARFWPSSTSGVYRFNENQLASVEAGLRAKAATVRTSRQVGIIPWQLTGKQCMSFGRPCQFLEQCKAGHHPVSALEGNEKMLALFDTSDPAARLALPFIPAELLENPDFVVLSASQYTLHSDCAEKYRIINSHLAPKETTGAQAEGTVFHAGVGEFYKQVRDWQQENSHD